MKATTIKLFLFTILFTLKLSAQDLEYLKSQDTIYLAFEELNNKSIIDKNFHYFDWEAFGNEILSEYTIKEKDSSRIIFIRVPKIESEHSFITVDRKRFLKKNKNKILRLDFIKRYEPKYLFFSYLGARTYAPSSKVIYFIDEKSLKNKTRKIVLKKAIVLTFGYTKI